MRFDVYEKLLASPVATSGTFTLAYKAGKAAADYELGGAKLSVDKLQRVFTEDADDFDVDYGVSLITVTYKEATTIPAGSRVRLQATLEDDDETFEDVVADNLTADNFFGGDNGVTVATAATTSVSEHGDSRNRVSVFTLTNFSLGNIGDTASLGIGAKLCDLPAGSLLIESASIVGNFDADVSAQNSTPEIGIGTTIASGAVSVLGGTAAFENVIEGATIADVDAEAIEWYDLPSGASSVPLLITASGGLNHSLYLNAAAAWADVSAVAPLLFTGVITVRWRKLS